VTSDVAGGGRSFRDPENAAYHHDGIWYRIAGPSSAQALLTLRESPLYEQLLAEGVLEPFDAVDRADVLAAYRQVDLRPDVPDVRVFRTTTREPITYPWEWPNSLLAAAGRLTAQLRVRLLSIGLDVKDASALNVQFIGTRPVFLDLGSIEQWRPNPGWNAARQFIEHYINPLAVGSAGPMNSAAAWELGQRRGLRSDVARAVQPRAQSRNIRLSLLQASARPVAGKAPTETTYAQAARANPDLARRATLGLTRRLAEQVDRLDRSRGQVKSTWEDYGSREHYASADLGRKEAFASEFIVRGERGQLVLDIGGNDGMTARALCRSGAQRVIVADSDAGALRQLLANLEGTPEAARITPLIVDVTNATTGSGLLGVEFEAFTSRVRPSAVICQAVLHHIVITQGVPLPLAVEALAAFGAPVQIEFADETDEKVRILLSQIPNWTGAYSMTELIRSLERQYSHVDVVGKTSASRHVVNAWGLRGTGR